MAIIHERVGVRELRQNLSVHLDRVKRGATLTVTEHNQVVAVLGPVHAGVDPLRALVASGQATAATRPAAALPKPLRAMTTPLSQIVRELGDDRA